MQPDLAHQPVHQKGRAGHVAGILEQTNEEKEQANLREKNHYCADSLDHPFNQQIVQRPRREQLAHGRSRSVDRCLDQIHRDSREGENALKNQRHHRQKNQHAPDLVSHHPVQPVAERLPGQR